MRTVVSWTTAMPSDEETFQRPLEFGLPAEGLDLQAVVSETVQPSGPWHVQVSGSGESAR